MEAKATNIATSIRQWVESNFPNSSEEAQVMLESTALLQVSHASLKNIAYAFASKELGKNNLSHSLSSRLNYFEAVVASVASVAASLFLALLYTALVVASFGISKDLKFGCFKQWCHVKHGLYSCGIGLVGFAVPKYGIYLNVYLFIKELRVLKKAYKVDVNYNERKLLADIKKIFNDHRADLESLRYWVGDRYDTEFNEFFNKFSKELKDVERMDQFVNLLLDSYRQFPHLRNGAEIAPQNMRESPAAHHYYE